MQIISRRVRLVGVALAVAVLAWQGPLLETPSAAPALLAAVAVEQSPPPAQVDPSVVRSRYITIDLAALPGPFPPGAVSREPSLPLELFPDLSIVAVFDRYDPNPAGRTWVGHVDRVPMSSVTLVYGNELLAGSVVMPNGVYSIRPAPAAVQLANPVAGRVVHVVTEVNQAALPQEAPPIEFIPSASEIAAAENAVAADTGDVIDLLVVYTPTAQAAAGGPNGIANLINLGVSQTNTSFANSNIVPRIRLRHSQLVNYSEVSSFSLNLGRLRLSQGALGGVAALRDANEADLVMMLVHPPAPTACGIAYVMTNVSTAFASAAFSVVDTACVWNHTVPHEIGHNMGARHDWYVSSTTRPYSYAHGYADTSPGERWRTIMSYNNVCATQGFNCTRTLYWSNPGVNFVPWCTTFNCSPLEYWYYPGAPMGIAGGTNASCRSGDLLNTRCDADNHRALNNTAPTIANLRQSGSDQ